MVFSLSKQLATTTFQEDALKQRRGRARPFSSISLLVMHTYSLSAGRSAVAVLFRAGSLSLSLSFFFGREMNADRLEQRISSVVPSVHTMSSSLIV